MRNDYKDIKTEDLNGKLSVNNILEELGPAEVSPETLDVIFPHEKIINSMIRKLKEEGLNVFDKRKLSVVIVNLTPQIVNFEQPIPLSTLERLKNMFEELNILLEPSHQDAFLKVVIESFVKDFHSALQNHTKWERNRKLKRAKKIFWGNYGEG